MSEPVDVVVVGGGAGGGAAAFALAQAGVRVHLLERGPAHPLGAFEHDELVAVRRDFFVPLASADPHVLRASVDERGRRTTFGWIALCLGGGTAHWAGYAFRMQPDDFRQRTRLGAIAGADLADWPLDYDELEPYYTRAERELGMSGAPGQSPLEPPRSAPLPLPPMPAHPIAVHLDAAARAVGLTAFATPRCQLSQPYQGRPACASCALCGSYGCPFGARGSTADALLPRVRDRVRVEDRACVEQILTDDAGRARGVVFVDAQGVRRELRARAVVLACSAVETPRLLLRSDTPRFPQGLANGSGQVGRHLTLLTRGGGGASFRLEGRAELAHAAGRPPFVHRSVRCAQGTLVFEFAHRNPIATAERLSQGDDGRTLWGAALKERLRRYHREAVHLEYEAFSRGLPLDGNRVDLDPEQRDPRGHPVARLTLQHHPDEVARSEALVQHAEALVQAMRPDARMAPEWGRWFDVLQSGTCRMGLDPARSVVDRDGRCHEVDNLYVVDGSALPAVGDAPPTLTIVANALRIGDGLAARFTRRELGPQAKR